jgi:hypothetical protein
MIAPADALCKMDSPTEKILCSNIGPPTESCLQDEASTSRRSRNRSVETQTMGATVIH